nr:MaoC family dehydratase [Bordetella petrii]
MMTTAISAAPRACTLTVTAQAIRAYAELTDDFNPLHLDEAFAARTPMGRVIAHGTLSVCLLWQWVHQNFDADIFGDLQLDIRFVKPVYIGDQLTANGQPREGEPRCWDVWVRGPDGTDRVAGTLRPGAPRHDSPET